ncbi:ead/Ea22-like family protein [Salmonella enterica]|nr:ead/Ea22-like family protein [Salmonella enterica]EEZ1613002.1 ead/Ea22-like family protein [Escherichia coli]EAW9997197.1 ead/Ea22-like family protein [Salmonella enterica]EEZ5951458.1 ead/Ea22-like family protein [Escherichia coli]EFL5535287.1 ead/Ea22-like family protein [Escherichia coli]
MTIDYQALRDAAVAVETEPMHQNFVAFRMAFTPSVALALLDEIKRLEDTNIDAMCRIAELETNLAALVAENAGLKHAMAVTLEHVSVTDAGQAGVAAMIINDALHHSETPATDAFLAEVRAQGVEMLAKNHQSIVNALKGDSLFSDGEYRHAAIVSAAVYFAAELRKGGNQ